MSREEKRRLQSQRLKELVARVYANCEPYRKRMQEAGVTPDDIQSIDDIAKLPFTSKKDFNLILCLKILLFEFLNELKCVVI